MLKNKEKIKEKIWKELAKYLKKHEKEFKEIPTEKLELDEAITTVIMKIINKTIDIAIQQTLDKLPPIKKIKQDSVLHNNK